MIRQIKARLNNGERKVTIKSTGWFGKNEEREEEIDGYVILGKGEICAVFLGTTFTLNPMIIGKDNKIKVLNLSVGGTMKGVYKDFDKQVEEYNKNALGQLGKITEYKIF